MVSTAIFSIILHANLGYVPLCMLNNGLCIAICWYGVCMRCDDAMQL